MCKGTGREECVLGFALSIEVGTTERKTETEVSEREGVEKDGGGGGGGQGRKRGEKERQEKEGRKERRERDVSRTLKERVGKRKSQATGAHRSVLGASCYRCTSAPPFGRR